MTRERYNQVAMDIDATRKRWARCLAFAKSYAALANEFAALAELVRARQYVAMTQADVAERMGIAQASVV